MISTMRPSVAAVRVIAATLVLAACGPSIEEPEDSDSDSTGAAASDELWGFSAAWPPQNPAPAVIAGLDVDHWCERARAEQIGNGATVSECRRIETLWCMVVPTNGQGPCYFDATTCAAWTTGGEAACEER